MEFNLCGLDFETNGIDPKKSHVTEIGCILMKYNTETKVLNGIERFSHLVYHPDYPPQTPNIIEITGITDKMLKEEGVLPYTAFDNLLKFISPAKYIFAHNARFDRTVFETNCDELKLAYPKKQWICTLEEVDYPEKYTCRKLSHLALDHGIKLDNRVLHRAINDVELMFDLITRFYDLEKVIAYALEPWVYVQAVIPAPWTDGSQGKDQAVKLGFGWEKARGTDFPVYSKTWVKRVKQSTLEKLIEAAPFSIKILRG